MRLIRATLLATTRCVFHRASWFEMLPGGARPWGHLGPGAPLATPDLKAPGGFRKPRQTPPSQDGPDGPNVAQDKPKTTNKRPKKPPRNPKRAPRSVPGRPQEANIVNFHYVIVVVLLAFSRCRASTASRQPEKPPRPPHDGPRGPQDRPKTAQEALQIAQEAPKTPKRAPGQAQDRPQKGT